MLRKIKNILRAARNQGDKTYESKIVDASYEKNERLSSSLKKNIDNIRKTFGDSDDLQIRKIPGGSVYNFVLIFIDGLVKEDDLNEFILKYFSFKNKESTSFKEIIINSNLPVTSIHEVQDYSDIIAHILNGLSILMIEGSNTAYALDYICFNKRSITDSNLEKNLRGPREAFIEDIKTNLALLRKRIKSRNFQVDKLTIGSRTNTDVAIVYIRDIVNLDIVNEVKSRLVNINYDDVQDSTYLAHLISDNPITIFPLMAPTEKPDKVSSSLLNGRIALLSDNSPTAILLPSVFTDFLHVQDDFYERFYSAFASRVIRYIGAFLAVFSTPIYIALTAVNVDMLPTKLAIPFSQVRYVVPFPLIVEALIMEITLEVLREAGLRIPNPIGPAISIVGGLVVGQTAVNAGLISPFLTIIVALSAIGSFTVTSVDLVTSLRIIKFLFIISSGVFGLFGLGASVSLLIIHSCSLTSFGVPYLAPFSETSIKDAFNSIFRKPFIIDFERNRYYRIKNETRVKK
ncbi:spore germination protein [Sporosalibacterium faouarense]|uniref:spore germination protein n=1 Tax=Sporosalibacterium faouarense TaxID=516123 RepID=UPI00192AFA56|nr:spore germination protein [Sporosalibacterium faouarense]